MMVQGMWFYTISSVQGCLSIGFLCSVGFFRKYAFYIFIYLFSGQLVEDCRTQWRSYVGYGYVSKIFFYEGDTKKSSLITMSEEIDYINVLFLIS